MEMTKEIMYDQFKTLKSNDEKVEKEESEDKTKKEKIDEKDKEVE